MYEHDHMNLTDAADQVRLYEPTRFISLPETATRLLRLRVIYTMADPQEIQLEVKAVSRHLPLDDDGSGTYLVTMKQKVMGRVNVNASMAWHAGRVAGVSERRWVMDAQWLADRVATLLEQGKIWLEPDAGVLGGLDLLLSGSPALRDVTMQELGAEV